MTQNFVLNLCFFLSGVSALIYEIVWSRMLITVFGASLYAVATISTVFLAGLALGAYLSGKLINAGAARRFVIYSLIECAIAACGVALPFVFGSSELQSLWLSLGQFVPGDAMTYVIRFVFVSLMLLLPTILMGATLPLLVGAVTPRTQSGDSAQSFYASNTTGGAIGALLGGFLFLPSFGLRMTSVLAAVLNLVAGATAMVAAKRPADLPAVEPPLRKGKAEPSMTSNRTVLLSIAFLSGFVLLMLEVAWTRWFSLLLGSSVYSLSAVLFVFLLSLGVGAWCAQKLLQRLGNGLLLMASAYFLSSTYILITLYAANEIPWTFLSFGQLMSSITGGFSFEVSLFARFVTVGILIAPPAMLMGVVLPLLLGAPSENKAAFVGQMYAANTLGAIIGACVTGFALIPSLSALAGSGIQWTMLISIGAQIAIAYWLFTEWSRSFVTDKDTRAIVVGIVAFVGVAVVVDVACFRPEWNPTIMSSGASFFAPRDVGKLDRDTFLLSLGVNPQEKKDPTVFYREGLNATVTVARDDTRNVTFLKSDGKVEAAIPTDRVEASNGSDTTTHLLLGALPAALATTSKADVLVIGYGSGTTAGAALADPRVASVTIAELEPAVYAADQFFKQSNGSPLTQGSRTNALVNDGRYVLASSPKLFDAIVCQPSDPWVAGASELFTENFWQLAKSRLKKDGVISQWVQMYSIKPAQFAGLCRTFASVFPNCFIVYPNRAGECVLLAFNSDRSVSAQQIASLLHTDASDAPTLPAGYRSLTSVLQAATIIEPSGVKALCDQVAMETHEARLNTDDRNIVEFSAAKSAMAQQQNIDDNIALLQRFAKKRPLI